MDPYKRLWYGAKRDHTALARDLEEVWSATEQDYAWSAGAETRNMGKRNLFSKLNLRGPQGGKFLAE
jgi:hypothetical protein